VEALVRLRWMSACAATALFALGCFISSARASTHIGTTLATASAGSSSLDGGLAVPGVQALDEGQQVAQQEEALRSSPEAVQAREVSRTAYENLDGEQARKVDGEALPGLIDESEGGAPALPAGDRITGYLSDYAASLDLGEGRHGVIESLQPLAMEAPGQAIPIDLRLRADGTWFQPAATSTAVLIPKRLGEGALLPGIGVSLTAVDPQGAPLGGSEGVLDGASVVYANTQSDTDTLLEPTVFGVEADTVLRSIESPEALFFRVGLPQGATLEQAGSAVNVVFAGEPIATVLPPSARDAAGTPVPVAMGVSGDVVSVTVNHRSASYEYPVVVDPQMVVPEREPGCNEWTREYDNKAVFGGEKCHEIRAHNEAPHEEHSFTKEQYGFIEYPTQGESHIYAVSGTASQSATPYTYEQLRGYLRLEGPGDGLEGSTVAIPHPKGEVNFNLCASSCQPEAVTTANKHNALFMEESAVESGKCEECEYRTVLENATIDIEQEKGPSTVLDTMEASFEGAEGKRESEIEPGEWTVSWNEAHDKNALYPNRWVSLAAGEPVGIATRAYDPGVGVYRWRVTSPNKSGWTLTPDACGGKYEDTTGGAQCTECRGPAEFCAGNGSWENQPLAYTLTLHNPGGELPEGEDTIESSVEDGAGLKSAVTSAKVKIDNAPPYAIKLTGLPSNGEISDAQSQLRLKATATDGSGSTPSSGIASITLSIDGHQLSNAADGCSPGPCSSSGEWALNTEEYGAGKHTFTVTATDNAGNVASESYAVTVHHAAAVAIGPGAVNPVTGDFSLGATDVSVGAAGGPLTIERSYGSRHLSAGAEGPLGPQWSMSTGAAQSISRTATGSLLLTEAGGQQTTFVPSGEGRYSPPAGDANLTLKEVAFEGSTALLLSNGGASTTFRHSSGGSASMWLPAISEGAGGTNAISFSYQTVAGVTEPAEELAPVPAGVSCAPTLAKGCRALTFKYAASTTASGEARSEWGAYAGRLQEVIFTAWEPKAGEMVKRTVADYEYDKQGRLRAEWNPQVSPALKTIYGYDAEGHVTAVTAAGEQPWLLSYGTSEGDPTPGRLIFVTRPAASTPFGDGEAPKNTVSPTLSSTHPAVGGLISVSSNGTWSNSPLAYGYQWEDCNSSGGECTPIPGAVNESYYPAKSDEGHTLVAQLSATNSLGTVVVSSAATSVVASGTPTSKTPAPPNPGSSAVWTIDYHVPVSGSGAPYAMGSKEVEAWAQHDDPVEATAFFPPDEPEGWPAENYRRASIYYLDSHDRQVNVAAPGGALSTEEYNETNDVVRTLGADNRQTALNAGGKSAEVAEQLDTKSSYGEEGTELLSTLGPQHNVALASGTQAQARASAHYFYNEGAPSEGGPYRLLTKTTTAALVAGKEEEVHTTLNSFSGQNGLGWRLRKPTSTTTEPSGLDLVHTDVYEEQTGDIIETRTPGSRGAEEPRYSFEFSFGTKGAKPGEFAHPADIAVSPSGDLYVLDTENDNIEVFNQAGEYLNTIGEKGELEGQFSTPKGIAINAAGDIFVADTGNRRVQELSPAGKVLAVIRNVELPHGVAVDSRGHVWVAETGASKVSEYTPLEQGGYSRTLTLGTGTEGSGEEQFDEPQGVAVNAQGDVYVSDTLNDRLEEYGPTGEHLRTFAIKKSKGKSEGEVKEPAGLTVDGAGDVLVADTGNSRFEEFSSTGTFIQAIGVKGSGAGDLKEPEGVAIDAHADIWVADTGDNRVSEWTKEHSAQDTQTIYYSAEANAYRRSCGEHPEWAGLPCQTQPDKQPEGSLPALEVSSFTYDLWDEPEKTTGTTGSSTRTATTEYNAAGWPTKSTIASSSGTALPTVTNAYNQETGALKEQSTTSEGKTEKITSVENSLGQLTSYTDADENTTTYNYDIDGRPEKVNDGKGTQTYSYETTTGDLTKLVDSGAGTFTASYGPEGNITSEGYPNGMSANYTSDSTGDVVALEYLKTTDCSSNCKWFTDSVVPTIFGQWASQASTFASQAYKYDAAGRLLEVQETPAGKGCTTRIYAYDAETNRTSLTTRAPGGEGKCATEGGATEKHSYDQANRLNDAGVAYEPFGNVTALPAADAGGSELTSGFYSDNQLASQTQNGQTNTYDLDPTGRTSEIVSTGKATSDTISHYAGPDDSPAWSVEVPSGHWTRDVRGINGALAALQSSAGSTELELPDLHGDIVATASPSESETKLHPSPEASEYGVPREGSTPEKFSWLGADQLSTELPTGVIAMGTRSYVPELGRFLQEDPVPGGSANAYAYTFGNPVNSADPSGEYTASVEGWAITGSERASSEAVAAREAELAAIKAAEEAAAREEAERRAAQEAQWAAESAAYWSRKDGEAEAIEAASQARVAALLNPEPADVVFDSSPFGFIYDEAGSRCEQYGGHWSHGKCVGIPGGKEDKKASCSMIASSVEAPYVWIPATWVPFAAGIGLCQVF
jgi:RHS repeat-associated protein